MEKLHAQVACIIKKTLPFLAYPSTIMLSIPLSTITTKHQSTIIIEHSNYCLYLSTKQLAPGNSQHTGQSKTYSPWVPCTQYPMPILCGCKWVKFITYMDAAAVGYLCFSIASHKRSKLGSDTVYKPLGGRETSLP